MNRLLVLAALLLFFSAPAARAQQVTTLRIHDGAVYVNGRHVPEDDLPASLDVRGVEAEVRFSGAASPTVRLGGASYVVRDGGLYELPGALDDPVVRVFPPVDTVAGLSASHFIARVQAEQAEQAEQAVRQAQQAERQAAQVKRHVAQARAQHEVQVMAARRAQQQYLEEVRRVNEVLYERLGREARLEQQTQRLALRVRQLASDAAERGALVDELRALLGEAFELKRKNREREIGRLEQELDTLRTRLDERRRLRTQIIERRLEALIDR